MLWFVAYLVGASIALGVARYVVKRCCLAYKECKTRHCSKCREEDKLCHTYEFFILILIPFFWPFAILGGIMFIISQKALEYLEMRMDIKSREDDDDRRN